MRATNKFMARSTDKPAAINWYDELKVVNQPDELLDMYIKNLKEEIRLL
jgi:hypothetical protein